MKNHLKECQKEVRECNPYLFYGNVDKATCFSIELIKDVDSLFSVDEVMKKLSLWKDDHTQITYNCLCNVFTVPHNFTKKNSEAIVKAQLLTYSMMKHPFPLDFWHLITGRKKITNAPSKQHFKVNGVTTRPWQRGKHHRPLLQQSTKRWQHKYHGCRISNEILINDVQLPS